MSATDLNGYHAPSAVRALRRADPALATVMDQIGPFRMKQRPLQTTFQTLLRAIVYQQLSGVAAGAIHRRVLDLVDGRASAPKYAHLSEATLRDAGLSRAKVIAIKDLCERSAAGLVPSNAKLKRMDDEAIVDALSAVRGIGRWSVEMMLIFNLRRPDVLPTIPRYPPVSGIGS